MTPTWLWLSLLVGALDAPLAPAAPERDAAAVAPLGLDEVLRSTQALFPSLLAAQADVTASEGERLTAAGAFDPLWKTRVVGVPVTGYPQLRVDSTVEAPTPLWGTTFFAGYRLGVGKFQSYYGERETWSGGELRAGAVVPVLRNGPIDRRRAAEARAVLAQSIAGLSLDQQRLELTRQATVRYWEWVAMGERREVARSLLTIARERDQQLSTRARVGDVARFDRDDNVRALVAREALVVQAQRGVEQAALELSLYVRDEQGEPRLPDSERMPRLRETGVAPEADLEGAFERRPEVRRLREQRRSAEIELRLSENQLLPALDLGVTVSADLGRANAASTSPVSPAELEVMATLDVPLLLRAPLGRVKTSRAMLSKLDSQLQLARDRVRLELNDARSALRTAHERVTLARSEYTAAYTIEQGERRRFELGESSLLFVNLREQATAEARLREIDALTDALRADAALRAALALGLPRDERPAR